MKGSIKAADRCRDHRFRVYGADPRPIADARRRPEGGCCGRAARRGDAGIGREACRGWVQPSRSKTGAGSCGRHARRYSIARQARRSQIAPSAALAGADLVLKVRRPEDLSGYPRGAAVVALMDPYGNEEALKRMADAGVMAFSLELIPRITRAQVMDVLSSQAEPCRLPGGDRGSRAFLSRTFR